jgi:hypothetical protein
MDVSVYSAVENLLDGCGMQLKDEQALAIQRLQEDTMLCGYTTNAQPGRTTSALLRGKLEMCAVK